MSWWNKFFGGKEEKELEFASLEHWLREKEGEKKEEVRKETQPLVEKSLSTLQELKEITLDLREKDIPEEVPQRARKAVETSKPVFVEEILKNTSLEEKELEEFKENLSQRVNNIGKLLAGKGRYLPIAFSDEMEHIGEKAKKLLKYKEKLDEFSTRNEDLESCLSLSEEIKHNQDKLKQAEKTREQKEERLEELRQEKKNLQEKIEEVKDSKKMKQYLQKKEEIEKLAEKKKNIEDEIYNLLSPLKRPLKKFRKYLQSSKDIKEMEGYLESPVSKFLHTPPEDLIDILQEIKENSQKIKLKPQDLEKVNQLQGQFNQLRKLKERHSQVESKREKIKKSLDSDILERKRELNQNKKSLEREINSEQKKLENLKVNYVKREKKISNLKKDLQQKVNDFADKEITISFDQSSSQPPKK